MKNKSLSHWFKFFYVALAITAGILMVYAAIHHNPQGAVCSYETSQCDIVYLVLIFFSWFLPFIIFFYLLDKVFNFFK